MRGVLTTYYAWSGVGGRGNKILTITSSSRAPMREGVGEGVSWWVVDCVSESRRRGAYLYYENI
jgi:hypothetical protein